MYSVFVIYAQIQIKKRSTYEKNDSWCCHCDVKSTFFIETHLCVESTDADAITRFCSEQRSKLVTGSAITSASACPGGAKKTCNGKYGTYYLYDDFSAVTSCDNYN